MASSHIPAFFLEFPIPGIARDYVLNASQKMKFPPPFKEPVQVDQFVSFDKFYLGGYLGTKDMVALVLVCCVASPVLS